MRRLVLISILFILVSSFISGQSIYDLGVPGTNYDISRDNNGNIHLVWVNSDNYKRLFYGRIVNNALTGVETVDLVNKVHVRFTRPRMAVQPNGSTIHVTYISPGPGSYLVHLWRDSGGTWRENVVWDKGTSKYYMAFPAVGVDASGNVHLVAQRWYGEVQNYIAYWRKSGGTWSSYVSIESNNSVPWRDVSMFTDSSGGVHATWKTGQLIYGRYRYAANGGSLANSTTINIPKATDAGNMVSFGDTFATDNGDAHHIYLRYADETLWHTVKRNGTNTFGELSLAGVVNNCEHCGSYAYENPWPAIGVGPDGTPVIAWAENRQSGAVNYINVAYKEGLNWVPTVIDNTAMINSEGRPVIAVSGTSGYLVWRGGDGNLKLLVYTLGEAFGVLSPNGGEEWDFGQTYDIVWNLENGTGNVDINLYKNDVNLGPIISDFDDTATPGKYTWTIGTLEDGTPIAAGIDYKIEVKAVNDSDSDISDNNFNIKPAIIVTSPNGGESWEVASSQNVTWDSTGITGDVIIQLMQGGSNQGTIYFGANTGNFAWTIDRYLNGVVIAPGLYSLQVKSLNDTSILDISDAEFTISPGAGASITVTSPNGGENWLKDSTQTVMWSSSGITGNVIIQLYQGGVSQGAIYNGADTGSYSWTINNYATGVPIAPGLYKLQVKSLTNTAIKDQSDADFTISPAAGANITVTSPNGGENWQKDSAQTITWTSSGITGNVIIQLYQGGVSQGAIYNGADTGSYSWTINNYATGVPIAPGAYKLQVKSLTNTAIKDQSDADFTISPAAGANITVTSPNGGENWQKDSAQIITWTSSGITGNVIIQLYQGGISRGAIYNGANTGSYSWTIDNYLSGNPINTGSYKVQVKSLTNTAIKDQSDGDFTISPAAGTNITVTSPNGGENWVRNSTQTVSWTSSGITGNVIIQLYQGGVSQGAIYNGANTGSYSWTIDNYLSGSPINTGSYKLQVKSLTNTAIKDQSDADFNIITI